MANSSTENPTMATDSGTPEAKMTVYYQREGFQIPSPSEVEACEPIDPDNKPNVLRFSPTIVVKRGCNLRPRFSEAKSLRFIADNTSLPVPKLHAAYTWGPLPADIDFPDGYYDSYMFVDYVPGVTLRSIWSKSTDEFKAVLKSELKDCLEKLRALPAPPNYIGTVENEGIWINYLGEYIQGHSTLPTERAFNELLVEAYTKNCDWQPCIRERLLASLNRHQHRVTFNHNDLHPGNIIVSADGHIQGIIDWAWAGWYPDHLEYFGMWRDERWDHAWNSLIDDLLPRPSCETRLMGAVQVELF